MTQQKLRVIPEPPKTVSVFKGADTSQTLLIRGEEPEASDTSLLCGKCEAVLAEIPVGYSFENAVLLCNGCGSYNAIE